MTPDQLADRIRILRDEGVNNINFVTPTHYTDRIIETLDIVKDELDVPVVWNTSGYEKSETVRRLSGYVDIFLTDFKYYSSELSGRYSSAPDYAGTAITALAEMVRITGAPLLKNGLMKRGTIVRHLVLPGAYRDSIKILDAVAGTAGVKNVLLSLMAQYTPEFADGDFPEIARRITTFEYMKALERAEELGFEGYMQSRDSAATRYTPEFI